MSQTVALLVDAYRDLNSRRMFWIVLILSALVAVSFAAIGLTPTGFEIFRWKIQSYFLNSSAISPGDFYKSIFLNYGIGFWLTWLATVLALISTASLFPDFIATGAVDLYLSKPISRLRLFLTKYFCGLLFVGLQIACFCLASFIVIGLRGGAWEPGIFLAVPIVVLFFSYLFCFCVLIGVLTRSTVAAVLLTFMFWVALFGVHTTEIALLTFKLTDHEAARQLDGRIADVEKSIAQLQHRSATRPTTRASDQLATLQAELDSSKAQRAEHHNGFDLAHEIFYDAKTVLPKTAETVALLQRKLITSARLQRVSNGEDDSEENQNRVDLNGNAVPVAELRHEMNGRGVGWIVGTSVGFEAVVLALAAWVFCRRDY